MDDVFMKAIEYIGIHGNPWHSWRVDRLLGKNVDIVPPPEWVSGQHENGGILRPYAPSTVASVGATSGFLLDLAFFGLRDTPEGQRALGFVWDRQQPDGRWTEDPTEEPTPPPPWFTPGDTTVDLWETANMATGLAALGFADDPRLLKAVAWAEGHVMDDGGFPGYIHTTYGMAAVQWMLGNRSAADAHLEYARAFLDTDPDIHDLNWGLKLFFLGAIPADNPTVKAYLDRVVALQGSDGFWPSIYGGCEVPFALDALELLGAYGVR